MDIQDFFTLNSDLKLSPFFATSNKIDSDVWQKLVQGNYTDLSFPILFDEESQGKMTDLLNSGFPSLYLVSVKFQGVLRKNNISGWKTFEVLVKDRLGNIKEGYNGFSVVGKCGPVNWTGSETTTKQLTPKGPLTKYYKGLPIGLNAWDGSDIFIPKGTLFIVVSKKVKDLLEESQISNISFKNLSDYETPEFAIKK